MAQIASAKQFPNLRPISLREKQSSRTPVYIYPRAETIILTRAHVSKLDDRARHCVESSSPTHKHTHTHDGNRRNSRPRPPHAGYTRESANRASERANTGQPANPPAHVCRAHSRARSSRERGASVVYLYAFYILTRCFVVYTLSLACVLTSRLSLYTCVCIRVRR